MHRASCQSIIVSVHHKHESCRGHSFYIQKDIISTTRTHSISLHYPQSRPYLLKSTLPFLSLSPSRPLNRNLSHILVTETPQVLSGYVSSRNDIAQIEHYYDSTLFIQRLESADVLYQMRQKEPKFVANYLFGDAIGEGTVGRATTDPGRHLCVSSLIARARELWEGQGSVLLGNVAACSHQDHETSTVTQDPWR